MTLEQLYKDQENLARIRPVVEQGALPQLDLNRQEQQVLVAQNQVLAIESEISSIQDAIARSQYRIAELEATIFRFADPHEKYTDKLRSTISRIEVQERDDKRYRSKYHQPTGTESEHYRV